jgi:hypothetical protein
LDRSQDERLSARSKATGKTRSELVRELIDRGLEERPLARRIGHLKGRLDVPSPKAGWPKWIKNRQLALRTWLVDTGPLIAYINRRDPATTRCRPGWTMCSSTCLM